MFIQASVYNCSWLKAQWAKLLVLIVLIVPLLGMKSPSAEKERKLVAPIETLAALVSHPEEFRLAAADLINKGHFREVITTLEAHPGLLHHNHKDFAYSHALMLQLAKEAKLSAEDIMRVSWIVDHSDCSEWLWPNTAVKQRESCASLQTVKRFAENKSELIKFKEKRIAKFRQCNENDKRFLKWALAACTVRTVSSNLPSLQEEAAGSSNLKPLKAAGMKSPPAEKERKLVTPIKIPKGTLATLVSHPEQFRLAAIDVINEWNLDEIMPTLHLNHRLLRHNHKDFAYSHAFMAQLAKKAKTVTVDDFVEVQWILEYSDCREWMMTDFAAKLHESCIHIHTIKRFPDGARWFGHLGGTYQEKFAECNNGQFYDINNCSEKRNFLLVDAQ